MKKILFLEDLYEFYLNKYKRSTRFSSKKTGQPLAVQVRGNLKFDSDSDSEAGLLSVHLQSCHTNLNVNGSFISDENMGKALPSFKNRPILGYIHDVDGKPEFYGHNMHENEDGDVVYDEFPVGIIPESCNAKIVYDKEKDKNFVEVDGYIFEEYSEAAQILKRENECSVSVELSINELSYNAKEKYLEIEDFFFSGVTILGKTPSGQTVNPGMQGANIKLSDFSEKNNSLFVDYSEQLIEMQEKLNTILFHLNNKKSKEGGTTENMFEKLLEKYGKSIEDIEFEYDGLTDEELEAKFAEVFSENNPSAEEPKFTKTFELSHSDIRYALYNLLSAYEDADNEYYYINDVYDDYFTYEGWCNGKIYGQKYSKDEDNVSFTGDRYSLHRELLTDSEYAELNKMRKNYASLVDFKRNIENNAVRAEKEAVLMDENYSIISEKDAEGKFLNEEFAALFESMDDYSLDDLTKEANAILGKYAIKFAKFSEDSDKSCKKLTRFGNPSKPKRKRYGTLFD